MLLSVSAAFASSYSDGKKHDLAGKIWVKADRVLENRWACGVEKNDVQTVMDIKYDSKRRKVNAQAEIWNIKLDIMRELDTPAPNFSKIDMLIDKKYRVKKDKAKYLVRKYAALNQIIDNLWAKKKGFAPRKSCGIGCKKPCCAKKSACGIGCKKPCCAKKSACGIGCKKPCCASKPKFACKTCVPGKKPCATCVVDGKPGKGMEADDGIPKISTNSLKTLIDASIPVYIFDARSGKWDDGRRIPGAQQMPHNISAKKVKKHIPSKHSLVVVYCTSPQCPASTKLYHTLKKYGYKNVLEYPGGIEGWTAAGLPVDKA